MSVRPSVTQETTYGNKDAHWVEYPSGLVDLSQHANQKLGSTLVEFDVLGERRIRIDPAISALVVVDMQNYFLHPELRNHPTGLECVEPLLKVLPKLRKAGVRILWLNWGLDESELSTIPPSLSRCFSKPKLGKPVDPPGLGADLGDKHGRILIKGEWNARLHGELEESYLRNAERDVWVHKNWLSGFGGTTDSNLELKLKELGIRTLLFAGVNADQCVLGTVTDSFSRGYDTIVVEDLVATTSPEGAKSNLIFNVLHCYGFVTSSNMLLNMEELKRI